MKPETIGPDGRASLPRHVHARQFDDELLLLDLERGQYFALNVVGTRIWQALVAGSTPAEVAALLAVDYDAAQDTLLCDCIALADELVACGLLEARRP